MNLHFIDKEKVNYSEICGVHDKRLGQVCDCWKGINAYNQALDDIIKELQK